MTPSSEAPSIPREGDDSDQPSPRGDAEWKAYPPDPEEEDHTVVGNLQALDGFYSPQLDNTRQIVVYLPPSYGQSRDHYPVIYMHDGQNLFDEKTSFAEEWGVDDTMETLSRVGLEAIVVGIANAGEDRLTEYSPYVDEQGRGGRGDDYLDFIVDTLKPRIDADFRTRAEREHTYIAGSSMGGLISLYAFFKRSDIFGNAGVMSPSIWFADRAIVPFVEAAPYTPGKVYLDVGSREGDKTVADVWHVRETLRAKGYRRHKDLLYVEQPGAVHAEAAWRQRLHYAIDFLLRDTW